MLCLGMIGGPPGPAQQVPRPAAVVIRAPEADHAEQPHTPELAETQLTGPETEIVEEHVLVLDHPRYGLLNGLNYLGYCGTCPLAASRDLCYGPCPAEAVSLG